YANFIRSHDEWSFRQVSSEERETVFAAFDPDGRGRMFSTGLRRRLAPLLGGDVRRLELAHSLLLTLPGTRVIYFGDEIGMGDDLAVEGRGAVRTAMKWNAGANGGFSEARAEELSAPLVVSGPFAYDKVNVAYQRDEPGSLLNWYRAALEARRGFPEFGRAGSAEVLRTGDPRVLDALVAADRVGDLRRGRQPELGDVVDVRPRHAGAPAAPAGLVGAVPDHQLLGGQGERPQAPQVPPVGRLEPEGLVPVPPDQQGAAVAARHEPDGGVEGAAVELLRLDVLRHLVETQQLLEGGAVAVAVEVRPHDAARLQERRVVNAGVGEAGARAQQQRVAHGSGVAHGQRH